MAAQVATESIGIPQVIAKINDPVRAAAYAELGVVTLCRTNLMVDTVAKYLNLPMSTGPGIDTPETPGHEHPHPTSRGLPVAGEATGADPSRVAPPARTRPSADRMAGHQLAAAEVDPARAQRLGFRRWRG
jgi:hypothetical protein